MLKVKNMVSPKTGVTIANQFLYEEEENGRIKKMGFQSYESLIAEIDYINRIIKIGEDWNYSRTTSKYRNEFFKLAKFEELADLKRLQKAINEGWYKNKYDTFLIELIED